MRPRQDAHSPAQRSYRVHSRYWELGDRHDQLKKLDLIVAAVERKAQELGRRLSVLDFGAGAGTLSLPLASLGHHVDAVDVHQGTVDSLAARSSFPTLKARVIESYTDCRGSYDVVICADVLEHLPDPKAAIGYLTSLVQPHGVFIVTAPNEAMPVSGQLPFRVWCEIKNRTRHVGRVVLEAMGQGEGLARRRAQQRSPEWLRLYSDNPDETHLTHITIDEIVDWLTSSGFTDVQVRHGGVMGGIYPLSIVFRRVGVAGTFDGWLGEKVPARWSTIWILFAERA